MSKRSQISANQVALSGSGGLSGSADSKSALVLDLAGLDAASIGQNDVIAFAASSAGSAPKKINFSDLEDAIFANISGDATVAAGGALTIAADAIESGMLNDNIISGQTALGGATIAQGDELIFSDDGTLKKVTFSNLEDTIFGNISGDATIAAGGALTIAAAAVEGSMLNDNVISGQAEMTGDVADTDEILISDAGTIKRADFSVLRDAVYNDVSGDATVAAGGALTIAANAVEVGMLHSGVVDDSSLEFGDADAAPSLVSTDVYNIVIDSSTTSFNLNDNGVLYPNESGFSGAQSGGSSTWSVVGYSNSGFTSTVDENTSTTFFRITFATANSGKPSSASDLASYRIRAVGTDYQIGDGGSGAMQIKASGVTNAMLAGSIVNGKLVNSQVTLAQGAGMASMGAVSLGGSVTVGVDGVLEDLDTLGPASSDGEFIVATGAGAFAYESGNTARTSLGLGTSDSPQFTGLTLTGDLLVQGSTTTVDSTTINISQSFTFEGPADDHETTLHAGVPSADSTVFLPTLSAGSYHLPALADAATDASAAVTAAEFALLDGGSTVGTTSLASGDGFLHNDGGTMRQTSIDKIADLFAGDGIAAASAVLSLDIGNMSSAMTGDLDDADEFAISDGGTMKRVDFSVVRDAVFADVSGDATVAAGGVLTIAANAVHGSMLNTDAISAQTEMTGDVADADELLISDGGVLKRADFSVVRDAVYADVSGDATIAAGGELTIAADAVHASMINSDVAGSGLEQHSDGTLRIAAAAAGNGLSGGAGSALALDLNELSAAAVAVGADSIAIIDADDNSSKKESIADLVTAMAGDGLSATSGVLAVDFNEISAADIAVDADSILFVDATDNTTKKESLADYATAIAGNGLSASSGALAVGVDGSTVEINSDALRVKALGIAASHLGAVAGSGLQGGAGSVLSITHAQEVFASQSNGTTELTLSGTPASDEAVYVFMNGLLLAEGSGRDYTISSGVITLSSANAMQPEDEVVVKFINQ